MTDRDDRIREVAYFLWLEEGCPEGQAERHRRDTQAILKSLERKRIEGEPPREPRANPRPSSRSGHARDVADLSAARRPFGKKFSSRWRFLSCSSQLLEARRR